MDPTTRPQAMLNAGIEILADVLHSYGFLWVEGPAGKGSGGYFASGEFRKGHMRLLGVELPAERILELHFRGSLGLVRYRVGRTSLSHEDYMWAVIGRRSASQYPGFSSDPLDGFRHLRADLVEQCSIFLNGSSEDFEGIYAKAQHLRKTAQLPE